MLNLIFNLVLFFICSYVLWFYLGIGFCYGLFTLPRRVNSAKRRDSYVKGISEVSMMIASTLFGTIHIIIKCIKKGRKI